MRPPLISGDVEGQPVGCQLWLSSFYERGGPRAGIDGGELPYKRSTVNGKGIAIWTDAVANGGDRDGMIGITADSFWILTILALARVLGVTSAQTHPSLDSAHVDRSSPALSSGCA